MMMASVWFIALISLASKNPFGYQYDEDRNSFGNEFQIVQAGLT